MGLHRFTQLVLIIGFTAISLLPTVVWSQWPGREAIMGKVEKTFGDPPGLTRLDPNGRVWVDAKKKRVVVDGYIAIQAGQLEMLACPVGTKEHESILALFCKAQTVHAGLLAIGAEPGKPVQWEPKYSPPTGSEIEVFVLWVDEEGKRHSVDAKQWVRELGTDDKTLDMNFVFAGSSFWVDPETNEKRYQAEAGDLICVSNFSTATLDLPMKSTQANSGLIFAAFTDRIPPRETPVRVVLQLVTPKKSADIRNATKTGEKPSNESLPEPTTGSDANATLESESATENPKPDSEASTNRILNGLFDVP